MRLLVALLLLAPAIAAAESSHVSGDGPLNASASIDFRIIIPPHVRRLPDGSLESNFRPESGWQYDEGPYGIVTLSKP